MSLINVSSLTFGYEGNYENASFSIDTNWKTGFIGRNGRGKTTFLNLLCERYKYSGSISKSVEFEYFPYEIQDEYQTPLEIAEVFLGNEFELWRLSREISLLEMYDDVLYRPFLTLSQGEQTKLLLGILFLKENAFLLIDEPTNHLDAHARRVLAKYLKSKGGFILVSHDRFFLDSVIDHVLSINRANIQVMRGDFSTWFQQKEMEDRFELEQNEKIKKDVKRLEKAAKQAAQWSESAEKTKIGFDPNKTEKSLERRGVQGEKSRKMMKRAKVIEGRRNEALIDKSALLKNIESNDRQLLLKHLKHPKRLLLECRDLTVNYGGTPVFENLSFDVMQGDRLNLKGRNGSGKSSLIKLILGEDIPHSGGLTLASGLKISYVSQSTDGLKGGLEDFCRTLEIDDSLFMAILRKLDFSRSQFEKPMESYSAGQKKKVLIAASLCEQAHLFIWDEPLNYIDVISRMQIEELLIESAATILFVEHDTAFIERVSTRVINLD